MTRLLPLALATLCAIPARAESTACDRAALARAEATVLDAQARYSTAAGWGAQNRALALVAASQEQLRTARQLCDVHAATVEATAQPFEAEADPFETGGDPEWCLVMGCGTSADSVFASNDNSKAERW